MLTLKILAFVFMIPGIVIVFGSRTIVNRFELYKNASCPYENEMSENEILQYKINKAVANIKMMGMLVALPGFVLVLFAFR